MMYHFKAYSKKESTPAPTPEAKGEFHSCSTSLVAEQCRREMTHPVPTVDRIAHDPNV